MRVLVVGIDGAIGGALATALRARGHRVVGTSRRKPNKTDDILLLDLAEPMKSPVADVNVAIICAAMARFEDCRRYPDLAERVNVAAPAAIAAAVIAAGGRVILLSTSAVFDCLSPRRRGNEPVSPRSAYGRLKARAEESVLRLGENASVFRLTKVVQPGSGVLFNWIDSLRRGEEIKAFSDHSLCPLPLDIVVSMLVAVVEGGEGGIYQVSGADDLTYAEAAGLLAEVVGATSNQVIAVPAKSRGLLAEEITLFTSLDTARLTALTGFVPPRANQVLKRVYGVAAARESRV
jgi:dTDP-4-dehydrorhamnose reductase